MITEIHLKSKGTYGSTRISREFEELRFVASKTRVARLMKYKVKSEKNGR